MKLLSVLFYKHSITGLPAYFSYSTYFRKRCTSKSVTQHFIYATLLIHTSSSKQNTKSLDHYTTIYGIDVSVFFYERFEICNPINKFNAL
jgi:hypothetical protein